MDDTSQHPGGPSRHTIAGTVLTMPVRVRRARQWTAMYGVDADAAQAMIDYSGLRVTRVTRNRAVVVLMLMQYLDTDLGTYLEYGTNVLVNPPGQPEATGPRALGAAGAFVHHLPVDGEFTLEAGRTIWGYPKVLADFTVTETGRRLAFDVRHDGRLIVDMEFAPGLPAAFADREQVYRTYSHADGITRETLGHSRPTGVRMRPGGVRLRLGDHPYAQELRGLGLPKRAWMCQTADNVDMTFGDATEIG